MADIQTTGGIPLIPPQTISALASKNLAQLALEAGDEILVNPKNPLASTAVWGLIVMAVTHIVSRYLPAEYQTTAISGILQAIGFSIGFLMALYGRWKATRPLGISSTAKQVIVASLLLTWTLSFIGVFATATGCQSNNPGATTQPATTQLDPTQQLIMAEDTYTTSLQIVNEGIRSGVISKATAQKDIQPVEQALSKALTDLETAVAQGKVTTTKLDGSQVVEDLATAWTVWNDAYAKFLQYRQAAVAPVTKPD